MSPIALRMSVAQGEFLVQAQLDGRGGATDFPDDELFAAPGRIVVEKDAVDSEKPE